MKFSATAKVLGILTMLYSLTMLVPIPFSYYYNDHDVNAYFISFAITLVIGFIFWIFSHKTEQELKARDGFLIVFLTWSLFGLLGGLPFLLSINIHVNISQSFFETISGLTTTGSTILSNIDPLPKSLLYYRQQLQFLGGMGIVVLAIAIMPLIGVGGMQLYKAEAPGPMKESKLTPRITETAKALWLIYIGLNIACAISYWLCGMSPFDAVCYAFSTLSTGGYANHNASMAYYPYASMYIVSIIFMILGASNFSLHFLAFRRMKFKSYFKDTEFTTYLFILFVVSLIAAIVLYVAGTYTNFSSAFLNSAFQYVSFSTTTGFVTDPHFATWPSFLPISLMFIGLLGGCAGSTAGGVKIIRAILCKRQISAEIKRLIHPNGIFPVKFDNQVIPARIMASVWSFMIAFMVIFIFLWLMLMLTGLDAITAFSALATCISNTGPGLNLVANNFSTINNSALWMLSTAMIVGRLEVFTVLVLLSPSFWRS